MKRQPASSVVDLPAADGFSLIEVMVSATVLILLVVMVTQLTNAATNTINSSRELMDADTEARMVFDRIANDIGRMVKRKDADYLFAKPTGNDVMYFYSEAPAHFDTSSNTAAKNTVALVGYRVNASHQLERLGKGLNWDGVQPSPSPGGMPFLTYAAGSSTPISASTIAGNWPNTVGSAPNYSDGTDSDYHVLGEQVLRMEISFLLKSSNSKINGTLSKTPYIAPNTAINGFQDISAIVVTIAILDSTSQKIVPDATKLIGALNDAQDGVSTSQTWLDAVNSKTFAQTSGIPQAAASKVRVYERYFYLNNN